MSAIASFVLFPKSGFAGLRAVALPKKRWFGGAKDEFPDFLQQHGREVVDYSWSGYVIAVVLPFLDEKRGVDLSKSAHDDLASYLTEKRGGSWIVLTADHKRSHLAKFTPEEFSPEEVRDFYNAFNETKEAEVGEAMLDGIRAIHDGLSAADDEHIVLLHIG
jgi:hypothetical protein